MFYNAFMFKSRLRLLLIFLFIFFSSQPVWAQTEFSTSYNVRYTISADGLTSAKYSITLTNNLSNIYATEFALSIGSTQVKNIRAYDQSGPLTSNVNQGSKTTNITIPFSDKLVGKDQSRQFFLEFDSLDFANRLGSVWEISIPRLSLSEDLKDYNLQLIIPDSLGQPAYITPTPISASHQIGVTVYRFGKEDLLKKGISATFGRTQYFDFSFSYHLNNPNLYPVKTEIALPPDTPFQQLIYQTLVPEPNEINVDMDGNWLAGYTLGARQNLEVLATGSAQIYLSPSVNIPELELSDPSHYLSEQKYWEVSNPRIQELAQQLQTPEKIYRWLVDNLIYDYGRLADTTTRFGAANALDKKDSAICTEFTDLFVALTRAAGIPARAVNGYAYTTNSALRPLSLKKDVLHAWPEYYSQEKSLWIPVDPTWANTTGGIDYFNQLDLNHFAFVILGESSDYPIPAGAYKTNSDQEKDVEINFGASVQPQPKTHQELKLPRQSIAGLPLNGSIIIKNTGNIALYNLPVQLTAQKLQFSPQTWTVAILPPFASQVIELSIPATAWNASFQDELKLTVNKTKLTQTITISPLYHHLFFQPLTFQIVGGLFSLLAFVLARKIVLKYSR
jgi:transglutaminase-like putative cysteine protease